MDSRLRIAAIAAVSAPLLVLALLLARPALDGSWDNKPAHFWLVLGAAAIATALGWAIGEAARRRGDARLLLISLAFVASAGFLGLHALATPGVLLAGPNAGFEAATPVGLVLAAVFASAAGVELTADRSRAVVRRGRLLLLGLLGLIGVWAAFSLAELPPLDDPLTGARLDGWQLALGACGVLLYGLAALAFLALHRRRRARFVLAFGLAFVLLAEAMVVLAWSANWHVMWWEWHLVMLGAFALIAVAARAEWHQERFSPLSLDETLSGSQEVSILFADLEGFTSFSERHDATEVASMLNEYFDAIVPVMERAGGEVHLIVGDELMVVFGLGGDQPDHPLQAARAGLLLQETAAGVAAAHEGRPAFRVGVNTGEVHTGLVGASRGHRKHDLVGDAVNLAARLQSEAPVGGVLIGETTFRALGARAVVEPLPPLPVKGKEAAVNAYVLHRVEAE